MLDKALHQLISLGLKDNEAQIYLACLQQPMGVFVHELVNKTAIKRSTIDLCLQRLRDKGFISRYKQGARWVYVAEPPEKLSSHFHERLQDFNQYIPLLLNMVQQGHAPSVRFYEGVNGIQAVFQDMLITNRKLMQKDHALLTISSGQDLIQILPDHYKQFVQKRVRAGIPLKIMAPDNPVSRRLYASSYPQLRETKFFNSKAYPFRTEIDIYGNKLALMHFNEPGIMATIIESDSIATSVRSLFQMIWDQQT